MDPNGIDIKPEGVGSPVAAPPDKFEGETPQQRIAGSARLGDLAAEYVFFTPGLLFTHAELDRDPVQEFMNEAAGEPRIVLMSFDKPVWDGFRFKDGRRDWNHKLIGIERGRWDELLAFLGTTGILDRRAGLYYRVWPFSVMIADPVVVERAAVLPAPVPAVEVVVFGLDGNTRRVVVQPPKALGAAPPRVVVERPDPKTVAFARRLLAGDKDPGESVDPTSAKVLAGLKTAQEAAP